MNLTFSSCLKDNAVFLFRLEYFLLEKHGIDVQGNAQTLRICSPAPGIGLQIRVSYLAVT